ncbi:MAG: universal stress protein [Deltaproteobacteria bacterium]|nr:universal stress protein [Deltaproteobacteria bacterium]
MVNNIDLAVINFHSKSRIQKLFLGTVTENVILSSRCSTLVIP